MHTLEYSLATHRIIIIKMITRYNSIVTNSVECTTDNNQLDYPVERKNRIIFQTCVKNNQKIQIKFFFGILKDTAAEHSWRRNITGH